MTDTSPEEFDPDDTEIEAARRGTRPVDMEPDEFTEWIET